ncbi:MAG: AAA family ATPase [Christensenellaceae bacterium]|jgi:chromosome partitioning protein|nr:AAA family ATPase [Christensenellaceae bacterium]
MGKIIAFANQKGGVGKTTTCINLSAYLALLGKKILIVDLDPQGQSSSGIGVVKTAKMLTIYNAMCDQTELSEIVQITSVNGLDIIPSNVDLAGAEIELVRMPNREQTLKSVLNKIKNSYDFICIDCPPSLGLLTVNALTAADGVIIPIQCEFFALEGVSQLVNTIRLIRKQGLNPNLDIFGVLTTMLTRSSLTEQVGAELLKYFGKKVFTTKIPRNIKLAEAPSHGKPICLYDPKCPGAKAYKELATEFMERQ